MTSLPEFIIIRDFAAPRALVWRTWTEPELLARWYGPGVDTIIHALDVRPGGEWRNEMRMKEHSDFSLMTYKEVVEPERLVWLHASTNADWEVAPNPMMPNWPRQILTTVTFTETAAGTQVTLSWVPHDATEAELACFADMKDRMGGGWGMGFGIIDEILAEGLA